MPSSRAGPFLGLFLPPSWEAWQEEVGSYLGPGSKALLSRKLVLLQTGA